MFIEKEEPPFKVGDIIITSYAFPKQWGERDDSLN